MFPRPLRLEKRLFHDEWTLLEPFSFGDIVVPAGFVTNGCSIPQIGEWDAGGVVGFEAGVIHDWLYSPHAKPDVSRDKADRIFYRALRAMGCDPVICWGFYHAVRLFGGPYYRRYS